MGDRLINIHTSIDCRPTEIALLDKHVVHHHQSGGKELRESRELMVLNGRPIKSGTIMTMGKLNWAIQSHQDWLQAFVTKSGYHPIVRGLPG